MFAKSHRWRASAWAAAALFGLWGTHATALSLGRITVGSALGEPLRAEIDVPDINAEEAATLKVSPALPEAFRAAGLEYNPALSNLQVSLQRRADGRAFIRLSSERSINDPFVDLIIEVKWASGRIVRDYTLLFDPPSLRQTASAPPTLAQLPQQAPIASSFARAPLAPATAAKPPSAPAGAVPVPSVPVPVAPRQPAIKAPVTETGLHTVKPGDTASKIATATKPAGVSLDQMLVALLRANPAGFIGDNVNRVRAGALMNIPSAEQAAATPAAQATQIIVAQSRDFNDFRRKLAVSAPAATVDTADRKASGNVQTKVEDKKPATTAPDKLTLSKGTIQSQPGPELAAKERSAKDASSRAAEIAKNISDLSKLGAASGTVVPGQAASTPAPVTAVTATGSLPGPVPTASAAPAAAAPGRTASSAQAKLPSATPVATPAAGLIDDLIQNPLLPAAALALIALLVGLGFYRARQRKNSSQVDSAFLESRLRPDSFFGASGGQSVDTNESAANGSSMAYSPSQLDAVDDVDPVAEADVYLAYGRDLQAEEILKDALRNKPARIAIHQKLLEIFAKRGDAKSFENTATLAFQLTHGEGSDWESICELGLSIDPGNALYMPGGQPNNPDGTPSRPAPLDVSMPVTSSIDKRPSQTPAPSGSASVDLDLDLDFSLDEEATGTISQTVVSNADSAPDALDLDITANDAITITSPVDNDTFKREAATSFGNTDPAPLETPTPATPAPPNVGMLEFDLGSLSLDLDDADESAGGAPADTTQDPLATKLALAQEFSAIGDDEGARSLIEEVIAEASGDMKAKAQRALNSL